jgi:hypothetical protein
MLTGHYRLVFGQDDDDGSARWGRFGIPRGSDEEFPFKVELWNQAQTEVDRVLAIAVSASLGYAAYYAATNDYPDGYITLRHNDRMLSRWNNFTSE